MSAPDSDLLDGLTFSRRALIRRAAQLGIGLPSAAGLLAACGGSGTSASKSASGGSMKGTIVLNNYPDWIGPKEIPTFEKLHPGAIVKQVTNAVSSSAEVVLAFKSGQYDFLLADTSDTGQAHQAGVLQQLDFAKIPNVAGSRRAFATPTRTASPPITGRWGSATGPTSWARRSPVGMTSGGWLRSSRPGGVHRPRARLHGVDAQVPRLFQQHHRSGAAERLQDRADPDQAAPEGVLEHQRRPGAGQRHHGDRHGLGLRRGAEQAAAAEDRVGRAGRGDEGLSGGFCGRQVDGCISTWCRRS